MERPNSKINHAWHVAINRFAEGKHGDDWPGFLYTAKEVADEVPRLACLFERERTGKLPKIHKQCSCCAPVEVPENHLTCCLGKKCKECPFLLALEKAEMPVEEIDKAKAWTCATHIIQNGGDFSGEGFLMTVDDRMYWDNVYESLAMANQPEDEPCEEENGGCPPDCGHTASEHQAFDRGVADGRRDGIEAKNPYESEQDPSEWDAWESGKSVGAQEHDPDSSNESGQGHLPAEDGAANNGGVTGG